MCWATHDILIGPIGKRNIRCEPSSKLSSARTSSASSHGGINRLNAPFLSCHSNASSIVLST